MMGINGNGRILNCKCKQLIQLCKNAEMGKVRMFLNLAPILRILGIVLVANTGPGRG